MSERQAEKQSAVEVLKENLESMKSCINWLERSYEQCKTIKIKENYNKC